MPVWINIPCFSFSHLERLLYFWHCCTFVNYKLGGQISWDLTGCLCIVCSLAHCSFKTLKSSAEQDGGGPGTFLVDYALALQSNCNIHSLYCELQFSKPTIVFLLVSAWRFWETPSKDIWVEFSSHKTSFKRGEVPTILLLKHLFDCHFRASPIAFSQNDSQK